MRAIGPDIIDLEDLAARIPDGAIIALPPDYSGCAMTAAAALVRRRARNLHLVGVPSLGLQADWLTGAGCVAILETAALTLGEHGLPPRMVEAVRTGAVEIRDATCPAIHAGLQAAEKGLPFMPIRGILGSDLLKVRPDWKIIDNPFTTEAKDPIVLVPAIRPDVALFHVAEADREGNVFIGVRRELMLMAHAARRTYVTVERIVDTDFLRDEGKAAGTIPALYVSALTVAPRGAAPIGVFDEYPSDDDAISGYVRAAADAAGFRAWCEMHIQAEAAVV